MGSYNLGGGGPFWNGIPLIGTQPDISGISYFVDGNGGDDDNTGKSWNQPFKTLEKAIYLSNKNISDIKNASRRNTIFVAGDPITTNLTTFPDKTDVVGCGSYNMGNQVCIAGSHSPTSGQDTRFYNVHFKGRETADPIINLTYVNSGFESHGCTFEAVGVTADSAITNNSAACFVVANCKFRGPFTYGYLSLSGGDLRRAIIYRCDMRGTNNIGISITGTTSATSGAYIESTFVSSRSICIYDYTGKFRITNNRLISYNVKGTAGDGIIVCNTSLAQGNYISGGNLSNANFPAQGTL